MFTGLVEECGTVVSIQPHRWGRRLQLRAHQVLSGLSLGDSIAVNGVCLSVCERTPEGFAVDVVWETLRKTTLGRLRRGSLVNLERALAVGDRLGGHWVQGHVDCTSTVLERYRRSGEHLLWIALPAEFAPYVVLHGSICVDGVSLTVARLRADAFMVALIPETLCRTTLGRLRRGSQVNLEFDVLGKYVERLLRPYQRVFSGSDTQ
jgi:riboflavin synthase